MCVWHAEFRKQAASAGGGTPSVQRSHHCSKPFPAVSELAVPMPCLTPHLTVFLGQLHVWDHLRASAVSHSPCLLSTLCTLPISPGLPSLPASLLKAKKALKSPLFRRERLSLLPFVPSSFRLSSLQSFAESQVSPKNEP